MAGELRHTDVGGILSRAEWEQGITHELEGQATGDLMFRRADGFLARIPVGAEGDQLTVVSGIPTWAAAGSGGTIIDGNVQAIANPTVSTVVA